MIYDYKELKHILNEVNADNHTRKIAKGLAKTNLKVACEYALMLPLRRHAEKEVKRSYDT